ncbi:Gfo/Idh/MocA family oxidoreductase [Ensifer sp. T173]|jgi:predicted dehydrogenase|uniref:Gfo/Idh/MocA family oxidoreductase n=1 Tax=Ensifer canadensis TaxID=555315 RepID=A0AAW4FGP5_9HYPH|nr:MULTISPECIES: Gfo/Idh/MocA family oxidoreductase [Ensifer]MDP9630978.1 putative dehydrogenase [Ensifer adhaerens]KQU81966.1 dehydrogenase [Ensifer sp. Root31]KQY78869.1 dehydrogenase [Ensifer sp. Root142]MBD9487308.1 Gfo/Idh/MocA family oxidoreductase [Ensifer sp. ENS11]MBM3091289.1 Gfo/Idh/MocA family oxidoreductase [Ensifer canadensis]
MTQLPKHTLRVGFVGTGFIAHFHLKSMIGVRNVEVTGVFSRKAENREKFAKEVETLGLGSCRTHESLEALLSADDVDAIWILSPNYTRLDVMRALHGAIKSGRSKVFAVACEKPLARTVAEAREMLTLAEDAGLNHGYLENQVFCTPVLRGKEIIWRRAASTTGRPYLARAAEEHSGPHEPWFWQGDKQGGGVLSDMMCHSVEVARYLLTAPGAPRNSLKIKSVNGTVANLKWTRPNYAEQLRKRFGNDVDYRNRPSEDFARATVTLEDQDGNELMIEATTSWAYVGAGLRIQLELLGPEYALEYNSLSTGLKIFMSREVTGSEGEDLVEKQNAEQGLMPVLEDEAGVYGYTDENRHMVECFRKGQKPLETFEDGLAVVEMLMGLYRSAEINATLQFPAPELEHYVPVVARKGA